MFDVVVYETEEGKSPFTEWFDALHAQAAVNVTVALARMESGNLGDVKAVGQGVSERRIPFGPGYRIYFGQDGQKLVVLLTGGTKKRQSNDIDQAKELWAEYQKRKQGG